MYVNSCSKVVWTLQRLKCQWNTLVLNHLRAETSKQIMYLYHLTSQVRGDVTLTRLDSAAYDIEFPHEEEVNLGHLAPRTRFGNSK